MDSNNTPVKVNDYMSEGRLLRKSSQALMPVVLHHDDVEWAYNIYPVRSLGAKKIFNGYASLAEWIIRKKTVVIDGYVGVFWDGVQSLIDQQIKKAGLTINWIDAAAYLKPVS